MIDMSSKIALYGDAKKLTQIENVLSVFLNKNSIPLEIHRVFDSEQFLREFFIKDNYRLLIFIH